MRGSRLLVGLVLAVVESAGALAAPPTIPWTAAPAHVGGRVTIEGVVVQAETTPEGRCVLRFDPDDPAAIHVVLLIPLVTDLPRDPRHLYEGKRVRVTGRITRFQRRLEMVVTPPLIEVVGLTTAAPAAVAPGSSPAAPLARPAPPVAPAAPDAAPVAPPPDARCHLWHDERTAVRDEIRTLSRALEACLAADRGGCTALGDRLGPPLSRLAAVEEHLARTCP